MVVYESVNLFFQDRRDGHFLLYYRALRGVCTSMMDGGVFRRSLLFSFGEKIDNRVVLPNYFACRTDDQFALHDLQ